MEPASPVNSANVAILQYPVDPCAYVSIHPFNLYLACIHASIHLSVLASELEWDREQQSPLSA
jgi:hypothetical protein